MNNLFTSIKIDLERARSRWVPALCLVLVLTTLFGCTASTGDSSESAAISAESQHQLTITAADGEWEGPEAIPAGWTEITLDNQSDWMRQTAFYRLDDDKTLDDVYAMLEGEFMGMPDWLTPHGGVSGVMPGMNGSAMADLSAGEYIVVDLVPEPDGLPGMAKGYFMGLTVEETAESDLQTTPPRSDLTLEMVDYAFNFDLDGVTAGRYTLEVSNSGPQEPHETVIVKLDEGATLEAYLAAMAPDGPGGPPPGQIIAGTTAIDESTLNYLEVEFEAGATYALICFLPSGMHGGAPHFALGMLQEFTIDG